MTWPAPDPADRRWPWLREDDGSLTAHESDTPWRLEYMTYDSDHEGWRITWRPMDGTR
jgi:hypothetical protein